MPNSGPRGFLAMMIASSLVVVYAVHEQQTRDRKEMHKGVIRDRERVEAKKALQRELGMKQNENE